ncbi:hypothetical protein EDC04DRAFT_1514504 [Pisolithus marmoratus]|nr:hypothetical protein EDC04DRAFT_1514504 [Pisolithus marmoratus]
MQPYRIRTSLLVVYYALAFTFEMAISAESQLCTLQCRNTLAPSTALRAHVTSRLSANGRTVDARFTQWRFQCFHTL